MPLWRTSRTRASQSERFEERFAFCAWPCPLQFVSGPPKGKCSSNRGKALARRLAKSVLARADPSPLRRDNRPGGLEDRAERSATIDQNAIPLPGSLEPPVLVNPDRRRCRGICVDDDDSFDPFLSDVADKTPGLCTSNISRCVLDKAADRRNGSKPHNSSGIAVPPAAGGIGERTRLSVIGVHDGLTRSLRVRPWPSYIAGQQGGRRRRAQQKRHEKNDCQRFQNRSASHRILLIRGVKLRLFRLKRDSGRLHPSAVFEN